ncbi:MAG: type II secretion system F family protein [Candidatus Pacearchaeota archaeon]|jgi:flagellar protein FlaJ
MKFKIPFTFSEIGKLKKKSKFFSSRFKYKKDSKLSEYLDSSGLDITREQYLGICLRSFLFCFLFLLVISNTITLLLNIEHFLLISFGISFVFSIFISFSQLAYPRIFTVRKEREIERNLLPALVDILMQLNSGIPLFNIMVNISEGDYGVLSEEFKKAIKKINAGIPEAEALNYLGKINPSNYFRRTLWQISNGMNSGSDMTIIIKESIKSLNEEQMIQIQNYGSRLNPIIVMYMLMAVIIPSLSVTFLTILSSMLSLPSQITIMMFISLAIFDVFFQIMFLGLIKSRRPTLL